MSRFVTALLAFTGLTLACVAKEPLSLSVVKASAREVSMSIPEEEGVRVENCTRVDVVVDIESSLDQVLSSSFSPDSLYFVADLEPLHASGHAVVESVRKTSLYAVTPEDPIPAARARRTLSFLVFYLGEHSMHFRVRIHVPNRKPAIDIRSDSFDLDLKKKPNQSPQTTRGEAPRV
jgi:hypothetical protein